MVVNGYQIINELNNDNSGNSKWGSAVKDGKTYFIKQFLSPVFPTDPGIMSPKQYQARVDSCVRFEHEHSKLYQVIDDCSRGNIVRIKEFFRSGSKYYIVTEKVANESLSVQQIAMLPERQKLLLCCSVAYCFKCLHNQGIIHFDVKPSNILVKKNRMGNYVPKLIDFDGSMFEHELPEDEMEIAGDLTYLAPETFLRISGAESPITTRADIFALALVLHEYLCGALPKIDITECEYPFEEVLNGRAPRISPQIPGELTDALSQMLSLDPECRPTANAVFAIFHRYAQERLSAIANNEGERTVIPEKRDRYNPPERDVDKKKVDRWFYSAGDL